MNKLTRRLAVLVGVATVGLAPAACGSESSSPAPAAQSSASGPGADSGAATAASSFPITLDTTWGTTTIPAEPTRIIALTDQNLDFLTALDVTPLATVRPNATNKPFLTAPEEIINDRLVPDGVINTEEIAALKPDLIIVANAFTTWDKDLGPTLSRIAPTIDTGGTSENPDWTEQFRQIAQAVGRTDRAEIVIDEITAAYRAVGDGIPEIGTKTYQFVSYSGDGFASSNGSVFEMFGLKPAVGQDNTLTSPGFSLENIDRLTGDLLAVYPYPAEQRAALESAPVFQSFPGAARVQWFDNPLAFAMGGAGPQALWWLLPRLTPMVQGLAG